MFAQAPDWKEHLDRDILDQVSVLLAEYEPASPASRPAAQTRQKRGRATSNASSTAGARRTSGTQTSCTPG